VVVHSASKYISGQGISVAGAIVSSEKLNQKLLKNKRYDHFNVAEDSYHGLVYADLVEAFDIYTLRIRLSLLRDIGATLSAFNAWQLIQGLETLSIRVKEHSKNALKVAEFLESHPKVKYVNYPGLKSSNLNAYVKANFTDGLASGLLSFEVADYETAKKVLDSVKIFSVVVNIGDSKSIITHPASTTHQQIPADELAATGISPGLIRLSIGLENADDLISDLQEALK
ncbi:MAG: PLP-dependent transferase, partial [Campylobacter lanienae]